MKEVHIWDVDGFVKISDKARNEMKRLIKEYKVSRLSKELKFDRETIYSVYTGRKDIHSLPHLIEIAKKLGYSLEKLEGHIEEYGRIQKNMYKLRFPFVLTPKHLRAVTIHGDGSFNKISQKTEWYQEHDKINYMKKLLYDVLGKDIVKPIAKNKLVSYITIPSFLVRLACKSVDLEIEYFHSGKFFEKISKLPVEYQFQVFAQFIVDEGHFKGTTFTISQKKQDIRRGFLKLLDSLGFEHSNPKNTKQDITIYIYNYPKIIKYLDRAVIKHGNIAGFWFKEKEFRNIYKRCNPRNSKLIVESTKINKMIFEELKRKKGVFSYEDIKKFGRTSREANKAIRNWKKNNLIKRIGFNRYEII